jgi:hypothetical protein
MRFLRFRCWWNNICSKHLTLKTGRHWGEDGVNGYYCEDCEKESNENYDRYVTALIENTKRKYS